MVSMLRRGDFDVAMDAQCSFVVEPDIDIAEVPVGRGLRQQLQPLQGPGARRPLRQAGARRSIPRSASATSARSRSACSTRKCTTSTRSSGTASSPTAQGAGLDDHARALPEPAARHGLAGGVALVAEVAAQARLVLDEVGVARAAHDGQRFAGAHGARASGRRRRPSSGRSSSRASKSAAWRSETGRTPEGPGGVTRPIRTKSARVRAFSRSTAKYPITGMRWYSTDR